MLRAGDAERANDLERAREIFMEIIEACPDYIPAYNDLGCLVSREGDYDWAMVSWEQAVDLGLACIPEDFIWEQDRIPWHFADNRPFLMALENLGRAHVREALEQFEYFSKLTSGHHGTAEIVTTLEPIALLD